MPTDIVSSFLISFTQYQFLLKIISGQFVLKKACRIIHRPWQHSIINTVVTKVGRCLWTSSTYRCRSKRTVLCGNNSFALCLPAHNCSIIRRQFPCCLLGLFVFCSSVAQPPVLLHARMQRGNTALFVRNPVDRTVLFSFQASAAFLRNRVCMQRSQAGRAQSNYCSKLRGRLDFFL
jgi:hypothetical protein